MYIYVYTWLIYIYICDNIYICVAHVDIGEFDEIFGDVAELPSVRSIVKQVQKKSYIYTHKQIFYV